jgi:hypothetical protein
VVYLGRIVPAFHSHDIYRLLRIRVSTRCMTERDLFNLWPILLGAIVLGIGISLLA